MIKSHITIIVCTYNRSDVLLACLDSIANQVTDKEFDVIIVNNNSTDDTALLLIDYCKDRNNWRDVLEVRQGLSYARNKGFEVANTEYVAYIDDDARLRSDWVDTAVEVISDHSPDIFGGPAYPIIGSWKPDWFEDKYGVRGKYGHSGKVSDGVIVGTNIVLRKELLVNYGGFSPNSGMYGNNISYHEETIIVKRAFKEGRNVYYSDDLVVDDLLPDYKKSILFFIYSKYKAGIDAEKIWKQKRDKEELFSLASHVDDVMKELNTALLSRGEAYKYPENYLIERVVDKFYELGGRVQFVTDNASRFKREYEAERVKRVERLNLVEKKLLEVRSELEVIKKSWFYPLLSLYFKIRAAIVNLVKMR